MKKDQLFKKYYSRLRGEGLIKSLIWGAIAGFALGAAFAFIAIGFNSFASFTNYENSGLMVLWISLGVWGGVTVISMPLFYLLLFKPDANQIAARIDRTGLEERLITMQELKDDDSYLATIQREDAKEKLTTVSPKKIRIKAFMLVPTIIAAVLMAIFATSVVVANVTVESPVAWNSYVTFEEEQRDPVDPIFIYFTIEYLVMGGGFIEGDVFQVIVEGEHGRQVTATPLAGSLFNEWIFCMDEILSQNPVRREMNVRWNIVLMAEFQPEGDPSDEPSPPPPDPDPDPDEREFDPDAILNGMDNFREDEAAFRQAMAEALAIIAAGGDIPVSLRIMLEAYLALLAA
ncbi:MAG: hypothetical protein FWE03_05850 [Firmicutes bacterium]|nr:hypothetical protein [Bacillota bacterium]